MIRDDELRKEKERQRAQIDNAKHASGNLFHVPRVGHYDLQSSFQDRVDRLPIHACAFHRQMSTAFRKQPFAQAHQLSRGRAESPHLLLHSSVIPNYQQTGHNCGLMQCGKHIAEEDPASILVSLLRCGDLAADITGHHRI